ncbi:hypothetical protein H6A12_13010, partial [Phocea massiliensis]|nr:hypothetical protein [Merdimmobilis hominis]
TIYIIDKQTLNCVPFCSKPNCKHDNAQCAARTRSQGIWMYQGALYVSEPREGATTETNELESYTLYKISLDGSSKDEVRYVGMNLMGGFVHRGYYYANEFDGVRRYSLTDKEENELIFEIVKSNSDYSIRSAYGNRLYISYNDTEIMSETFQVNIGDWDSTAFICGITRSDSTDKTRIEDTYIGSYGEELVMMNVSTHTDYSKLYSASVSITDREGKNEQVLDYIQSDLDTTMFGSVLIDDQYCYQLYVPPITGSKELWQ